jgi:methylenetetrahydrofolate reductase (NADPH)
MYPCAHPALGITVPVIPGVLPIQTYASFVRVTKLCGTYIPDAIQADLEPIKVSLTYVSETYSPTLALPQHDDQKVKDYGVSLAVKMVRRLVDEGGLQGFHFCTLNLEKSVERVLENLGWTPRHARVQNKLIAVSIRDKR